MQRVTVFSATIVAAAPARAAHMLLEHFTDNAARPLYEGKGLAPAF